MNSFSRPLHILTGMLALLSGNVSGSKKTNKFIHHCTYTARYTLKELLV